MESATVSYEPLGGNKSRSAGILHVMGNVLYAVEPTLDPDVDRVGHCRTARHLPTEGV